VTGTYSFTLTSGEDFATFLTWLADGINPTDLTSYAAEFVLVNSAGPVLSAPMTLGGEAGTLSVAIPAADITSALSGAGGGIRFRLMTTDGSGFTSCLLSGPFVVNP
jgi:hypothetical protein